MQGGKSNIIQDSQCFKCQYAFRFETLTHLFPLQTSYLFMFFVPPPFFCQAACCDTESTALQSASYRSGAPAQHGSAGYWGSTAPQSGNVRRRGGVVVTGGLASPAPRR